MPGGLFPDPATCTGGRLAAVARAIEGVGQLAEAGFNALDPDFVRLRGNPASYFFGPSPDTEISYILMSAFQYTNQKLIRVNCTDLNNVCTASPLAKITVSDHSDRPGIILCDPFFFFPRHPPGPCMGGLTTNGLTGVGGMNQAQILLHEFTHAFTLGQIADHAYGSRQCHALLFEPGNSERQPRTNADSYSRFASWAYDLGFESLEPGARRCPELFRPEYNLAGEFPSGPAMDAYLDGARRTRSG